MNHDTTTRVARHAPYPDASRVYGMVIDSRLADAMIRIGLDALRAVDGELLVFLCLAPHDIRSREEWPALEREIGFANGKREYEVRMVTHPEELLAASLQFRVLRLPTDTVYI